MRNAKEIVQDAESLPVEQRALVVDLILRTLNAPDSEIDRRWVEVAKRRLEDLRSGRVNPIPGDQVLARVRERFSE